MAEHHLPLLPEVMARIETGMSVRKACEEVGIPHGSFWRLVVDEPQASQYARARSVQAHALVSELVEAARAEPERVTITIGEDATKTSVDSGEVQHRRLKIDTLKWAASKILPKEYGDRVQVDATVTNRAELLDEADKRAGG